MTRPREPWLDALRGYAALVVVCFHLSPQVLGPARHLAILRHIDLGKYAVLLFFLVSGYVIPMSMERHGSLRRFWIGRLCRIFPAYLAAIALVAVLVAAGLLTWPASLRADPTTGVLAHATMLSDLLGQRGALRVFWTLSYEMTFYLVASGLYAWNLHRHSARWAAGLALTALIAGPALPDDLLGAGAATRRLTALALLLLVALSITAYVAGRLVPAAGAAGIALVLLPALNAHATRSSTVIASWQGLLLLAVMFAGTVVHRLRHGQLGRRPAALALAVVALSVVGAHGTHLGTGALRVWLATTAAVALTFTIAYAVGGRPLPAVFGWSGKISYSLYLLHIVVLAVAVRLIPDLGTRPVAIRLTAGLGCIVAALGLAWISYHMVESPGLRLGRRLAARLDPAPQLTTQRAAPGTGRGRTRGEASRLDA